MDKVSHLWMPSLKVSAKGCAVVVIGFGAYGHTTKVSVGTGFRV